MELTQCEIKLKEYEKLIGTNLLHKSKTHSIFVELIHCVPNFGINDSNLHHIRVVFYTDNPLTPASEEINYILANYIV